MPMFVNIKYMFFSVPVYHFIFPSLLLCVHLTLWDQKKKRKNYHCLHRASCSLASFLLMAAFSFQDSSVGSFNQNSPEVCSSLSSPEVRPAETLVPQMSAMRENNILIKTKQKYKIKKKQLLKHEIFQDFIHNL